MEESARILLKEPENTQKKNSAQKAGPSLTVESIHLSIKSPSKKPPNPCPASLVPRRSSPCLRLWVHVDNPPHAATLVGLELMVLMVVGLHMSKSTTRIAKLLDLEKSKTGNARAIVDWFMLIVNRLFISNPIVNSEDQIMSRPKCSNRLV